MARAAKVPKAVKRHSHIPIGDPYLKGQETLIRSMTAHTEVATAITKHWARRVTKALDLLEAIERGELVVKEAE